MVQILEIETEHVVSFKALIEVLKEMLTEVIFEFRKEAVKTTDENDNKKTKYEGGLRVLTVNATKTVLIYLKLDISEFSKFECKQKLELGINLKILHILLKSIEKGDTLCMRFDDTNKQFLSISAYNSEKDSISNDKLKLMDLDNHKLNVPSTLKYDINVTMSAKEFHKLCKEFGSLSEHIELKCTASTLNFKCKTDSVERDKTFVTTGNADQKKSINISHVEKKQLILQGVYELKDLTLFNKCSNLCGDVEIVMKNNHPLILKYTIGTAGKVLLCISPIELNTKLVTTDVDDCVVKYK